MKRICSFLLTLILLLGLTACGQGGASSAASASGGPTWQEQYDLGVRYLSEGSYAEAILAFTAAIDIDPKRPDAFIGRGDAYVGTAQLAAGEDAAELPEESKTAYGSAVADYLAAIGLDKLLAAVYGKASDVYLALGDREAALAILQQGYEATGDGSLLTRAKDMQENKPDGASETVTVEGYLFDNATKYEAEWDQYSDQYGHSADIRINSCGVYFSESAAVMVDGERVEIQEALPVWGENMFTSSPDEFRHMIDQQSIIHMTGYFYKDRETERISGPRKDEETGETYYLFRPNGDYIFFISGYEKVE